MFKGFRRSRHAERLKYHYLRIEKSLVMREQYMQEGRKGMVLAVNYELVSDATRALDALRRTEELTPDQLMSSELKDGSVHLRVVFSELLSLPALPMWRVTAREGEDGRVTPQEIDDLYDRFLESFAGSILGAGHDVEDEPPFWARRDVRSLIAVIGMTIVDMGKVEDVLWPDEDRRFREPAPGAADYKTACSNAVHAGAILALAAEHFRRIAESADEEAMVIDRFLQLPNAAYEVADEFKDFAAWFGGFGRKSEREIRDDFDRLDKTVGPALTRALQEYADALHRVMSEDGPYDVDGATWTLQTIRADEGFEEHCRKLWRSVDLGKFNGV